LLVVLPAWNEEASVAHVVKEVRDAVPQARILVVDDGSTDGTADAARGAGATVISSPLNLGVGFAMRIGFRSRGPTGTRTSYRSTPTDSTIRGT
jgi:glycosyltransferase involved in cell wall biosynthesis